jgi:tetratricopeptide (TPR) repeat protein
VFLYACTPKTTQPVVDTQTKLAEPKAVPCPCFANLNPSERDQAENAFVLYKDFFGLGDYENALPLWKKAYTLAPGSNGRVKSHFDDGITLYADLMGKAQDTALRQSYMDTIHSIYAKRELCFDADQEYYAQKAFDYYYKLKDYLTEEEVYDAFVTAIEVGDGEIPYYIINPFTKVLYDRVYNESIDLGEASTYAVALGDAIEQGLSNCQGAACDSWTIINEYSPDLLSSFEGVDGFYNCEYYTSKYYALFEENPEDCKIINMAYSRLLRGGCAADHEKLMAIKMVKDDKCFVPPPPPGLLRQAYTAYQDGDFNSAVSLFEQFVNENDDHEKKAKYLMLIAKIYYGDIKNYPKSRTYALKAADIKAGWGEPYILIGKLYASSGSLCGPGRGWDSQIVTWPAIDKFYYAKKIDPSAADEANKWINNYKKYMPKKEDIFLRGISAGSTFRVGCWIQENTIVRTAD